MDSPLMLDIPLSYLHRPAAPSTPSPWLLVLLHGVGSQERDLFELHPFVPKAFHVLSLRAPHRVGPGAFAWFAFSVGPDGSRQIHESQEAESRKQVAHAVEVAARELGIAPGRVVVGGFSQGGIMALSLLLTRPELMRAALVWHGRLLAQALDHAAPPEALQGKNLWVSHGLQDHVIPLANAHAIREHVQGLPLALTYAEFPGAHEIRPAELQQAMTWLVGLMA